MNYLEILATIYVVLNLVCGIVGMFTNFKYLNSMNQQQHFDNEKATLLNNLKLEKENKQYHEEKALNLFRELLNTKEELRKFKEEKKDELVSQKI